MWIYYFCIDIGKEMELWMKVMLDVVLVQIEFVKRVDKIIFENVLIKESNNIFNYRVLIKLEI